MLERHGFTLKVLRAKFWRIPISFKNRGLALIDDRQCHWDWARDCALTSFCQRSLSHGFWNWPPLGTNPEADTLRDLTMDCSKRRHILKLTWRSTSRNFLKLLDLPIVVVALTAIPYHDAYSHALDWKWHSFLVSLWSWCKRSGRSYPAKPNTATYGSLSIAVRITWQPALPLSYLVMVFVPAPNVDSAILKMVRRPEL